MHPQPFGVTRVVRYFAPENEYVRGTVTLPQPMSIVQGLAGPASVLPIDAFQTTVHCPDTDVVLEMLGAREARSQLRFKYCPGPFPSTGDFYVLIYNDPYMASLSEVWQFVVHSTLK